MRGTYSDLLGHGDAQESEIAPALGDAALGAVAREADLDPFDAETLQELELIARGVDRLSPPLAGLLHATTAGDLADLGV